MYLAKSLIQMDTLTSNDKTEVGYEKKKIVIIVAKPGRIRDSLEALLRTIFQILMFDSSVESSATIEMISEYNPDLVLLVTNLPDERTREILAYLKDVPKTQCLVLANTKLHLEQAEAAGADEVLLTGFPTTTLFASVSRLLSV